MKQIFLVEDDREIAKNLTRLLETEGFSVRHAPTQAEAVQLLYSCVAMRVGLGSFS